MAKQINVSVGGVVKKVKEVPLGIGGVVKKAKSGICGVGGVVKEFFTSELVLFENGSTNYTWDCDIVDGKLEVTDYVGISESFDLSGYTKCGMIFTDRDISTSAYPYGSVRFTNRNLAETFRVIVDHGWDREQAGTITVIFDLNEDGKFADSNPKNFRPRFLFQIWESDWVTHKDFYGKISKIWFE